MVLATEAARLGALAQATGAPLETATAGPRLPASRHPRKCLELGPPRCLGSWLFHMTRGLPCRPKAAASPLDPHPPRRHPSLTSGSLTRLQQTVLVPHQNSFTPSTCSSPQNHFWSARHLGRVWETRWRTRQSSPCPQGPKSDGKDSHKIKTGCMGPRLPWKHSTDLSEEMSSMGVKQVEVWGKHFQRRHTRAKARGWEALEGAQGLWSLRGREKTGPGGASGQLRTCGSMEASPGASGRGWAQEGCRGNGGAAGTLQTGLGSPRCAEDPRKQLCGGGACRLVAKRGGTALCSSAPFKHLCPARPGTSAG